jgi:dipeptidase
MIQFKHIVLISLLWVAGSLHSLMACTIIAAGKDATASGSVMIAANDDWPGYPGHLNHVDRKKYQPGAKYSFTSGFQIPQVAETYAYNFVSCAYETGIKKESWLYGMNEHEVGVVMAGAYNFRELNTEGAKMQPDDLPWLVLERATTAREALEIITTMIRKYGLGGGTVDEDGSVTMAIADPNEVWIFEPIPGGVWLATRVPDNMVAFRPNCIGTHEVDLADSDHVLYSDNMIPLATKHGWYKSGEPFDYVKTYCLSKEDSEGFHETDSVNALRRWRMACLFSGNDLPENELIYAVVPAKKLTVESMAFVLRDYLLDTPYDPTKQPEAGPFGNPFHVDWGNTLSRSGTCVSVIMELRTGMPSMIGGVLWVCFDTPATSIYTPWHLGITETPEAFQKGEAGIYDPQSAWWNFQEVGNLCYRRFDEAALKDVIPVWRSMEQKLIMDTRKVEQEALRLYQDQGPDAASRFLNDWDNAQGRKALQTASELANKLRGKFLDNTVIE